jgi:3-dehydroquinate dehydratase-2
MKQKISIINGPNLNLLGEREKSVYGSEKIIDIEKRCQNLSKKINIDIDFFQSNVEGEIINHIQGIRNSHNGIIINAGAYTHTSVGIHDALKILKIPIIEVHMSNIYRREEFRHKSLISYVADAIICGLGSEVYLLAIQSMKNIIQKK